MPLDLFFMKRVLTVMIASISPSLVSQDAGPALKLDLLRILSPALIGFYGNPALAAATPAHRVDWLPGGRVLSMHRYSERSHGTGEFDRINFWQVDPQTSRLVLRGMLDAGGATCHSIKGDLLCAQVLRKVDEPSLMGIYSERLGSFGCFRWSDASRIWKLPYDAGEECIDSCFTLDDKRVALLVQRSGQAIVRILDAASGEKLHSVALPGRALAWDWYGRTLVAARDDLWVLRNTNDSGRLMRVPLDSLIPEEVQTPFLASGGGRQISVSADGRRIAVSDPTAYVIIEQSGPRWNEAIRGSFGAIDGMYGAASLALSSDGKYALAMSTSEAKFIDIAAHRVGKAIPMGGEAFALSPDGSSAVVISQRGSALWNLRSGKPLTNAPGDVQNEGPPKVLRYVAGGKGLLAADWHGLTVWDTATRRPRARLILSNKPPDITACSSVAVVNGGSEVISSDAFQYLRWKLPSMSGPPPAKAALISSQRAFPSVARQDSDGRYMDVASDATGTWLLTIEGDRVALRDIRAPGVMKPIEIPGVLSTTGAFVADLPNRQGFVINFPAGYGDWLELPFNQKRATPMAGAERRGDLLAILPNRNAGITSSGSDWRLVDGRQGQEIARMIKVEGYDLDPPLAASPDEKLLAGVLAKTGRDDINLAIWDIASGNLIALQLLPSNTACSLSFSPDGSRLVCGHDDRSLSEWDVAKLLVSARYDRLATPVALSSRPAVSGVTEPQLPAVSPPRDVEAAELPVTPEVDGEGIAWTYLPGGMLAGGDRLPQAGRLLVGGDEWRSEQVRMFRRSLKDQSGAKAGHEGPALGGQLWVSRHLGRPSVYDHVWTFFDTFTNVSDKAVDTTVSFEMQMPADTTALLDSDLHVVDLPADGILIIGPRIRWLAPSRSGRPGDRVPLFRCQNASSPAPGRLKWDAVRKVVSVSYDLKVVPGECRHLIHQVHLQKHDPQAMLDIFETYPFEDVTFALLPVVRDRGINFGRAREGHHTYFSGEVGDEWLYEPRSKDAAGFGWTPLPGMGMEGELGAASVFLMRFGGRPLAFGGRSLMPAGQNSSTAIEPITKNLKDMGLSKTAIAKLGPLGDVVRQHPDLQVNELNAWSADGKLSIVRRPPSSVPKGMTRWEDVFTNSTDQDVPTRVSYITTFRDVPITMWNAAGQTVDLKKKEMAASYLGGTCMIAVSGDQQPATVLNFHRQGSRIEPQLRWLTDKVLAVEFSFTVPAHSSRRLVLAAGQRLVQAVGGAASALKGAALEVIDSKLLSPEDRERFLPMNFLP